MNEQHHDMHHELQRPTETPFLAIFVSRSSWILRVIVHLWFRKVKVKRCLTLDPQVKFETKLFFHIHYKTS